MYKVRSVFRTIVISLFLFVYKNASSQITVGVDYNNIRDGEITSFYAFYDSDTVYIQSNGQNKHHITKEQQTKLVHFKNVQFGLVLKNRVYVLDTDEDLLATCNMIEITLRKRKTNIYSASLRYCESECLVVTYPDIATFKVRCNRSR